MIHSSIIILSIITIRILLEIYSNSGSIYCGRRSKILENEFFQQRIVFGEQVYGSQFPYMASIFDCNFQRLCGGSFIHPQVVLTAAHCYNKSDPTHVKLYVLPNVNNLMYPLENLIIEVDTVLVHESWTRGVEFSRNGEFPIDAALMLLKHHDPRTKATIKLPNSRPRVGTSLTLIGFGRTGHASKPSARLKMANVTIYSNQVCRYFYGKLYASSRMFCSTNDNKSNPCYGDSGGPLVKRGKSQEYDTVVGVVSFGPIPCDTGFPSIYTDTFSIIPWIRTGLNKFIEKIEET